MKMSEFEYELTGRLRSKLTRRQLAAFAAVFYDNWTSELGIDPDHSLIALDMIIAKIPMLDGIMPKSEIRSPLHHWHTNIEDILEFVLQLSHQRRTCKHCGQTSGYKPSFNDEDEDEESDEEECDE